jgi:hypothetical protein
MAAKKSPSPRKRTGLPIARIEIEFVLLGDFAQAVNGKLTVVGAGWNIWNAPEYPSVVPFGLGIGILVPWTETNRQHAFSFVIKGSEGPDLATGDGNFEVGRQPGIPAGMTQRVVIGVSGQVRIEGAGTYEIHVSCAGDKKKVIFEALAMRQLPQFG